MFVIEPSGLQISLGLLGNENRLWVLRSAKNAVED